MTNVDKEKWTNIKEYENYKVSNLGRVKNVQSDKFLKTFTGAHGYKHVNLCNKTGRKQWRVHRLVMLSFTIQPKHKNSINHIDGDKANNELCNLEWCTDKENSRHAVNTGLHKGEHGEKNPRSLLKTDDVLRIKTLYTIEGYTQRKIADKYNISQTHVSDIISGKRWKHVTKGLVK